MTDHRKPDLNLNLVWVLEALLEERNLTHAGDRVGMTQPTVSGALARLREIYDDPLLERDGRGFALTPRAEALIPGVEECMEQVRRTFEVLPTFDPATSTRTFMVCASDYVLSELTGPLLALLAQDAPGTRVEFTSLPVDASVTPVDLLRHDVTIAGAGRGLPGKNVSLFSDWFVCVADARNPAIEDGALSLGALRRLRHVRSEFGAHAATHVDDMLAAADVAPSTALTVQGFIPVPFAVAGTDWIGWVPERTAQRYGDMLGLAVVKTPLAPKLLVEAAYWHPTKTEDPARHWLIEQLRRASEIVEFGSEDADAEDVVTDDA
ncbi:LysR family transcriptional regulator [Demequina pelophila]|uniref:LysR family transcriptional regulator n=1 Tax=Demequina pelophila TaxID=1638984 RepID=UPI0007803B4A|nr:LysR family transcriptional regulator [Demequina pelophila]